LSTSIARRNPGDVDRASVRHSLWRLHLAGYGEVRNGSYTRESSTSATGLSTDLEEVFACGVNSSVGFEASVSSLSQKNPGNTKVVGATIVPPEFISVASAAGA